MQRDIAYTLLRECVPHRYGDVPRKQDADLDCGIFHRRRQTDRDERAFRKSFFEQPCRGLPGKHAERAIIGFARPVPVTDRNRIRIGFDCSKDLFEVKVHNCFLLNGYLYGSNCSGRSKKGSSYEHTVRM